MVICAVEAKGKMCVEELADAPYRIGHRIAAQWLEIVDLNEHPVMRDILVQLGNAPYFSFLELSIKRSGFGIAHIRPANHAGMRVLLQLREQVRQVATITERSLLHLEELGVVVGFHRAISAPCFGQGIYGVF
ncbi:hypothetical protein M233_10600 [Xylella fastidiosa subsp. multiplex Griffin-1]|nr:hypothetical protein M233_10600 [Xylella fastidiosa subsp. multiplex Griffin-1]